MTRVTGHSPYSSSLVRKTEPNYSSIKTEYVNSSVNTVTPTTPIPYLPPTHSVYPPVFSKQMMQNPVAELKSQLGLDAGITPINGIHSTVAYFGSGTAPIHPPRTTTSTQHSTMVSYILISINNVWYQG